MPENLDQIAAPPAEYEQIAGMRVALQSLLDLQGHPVHPAPHIGVPGGDPHPHTGRNRDHRTRALTTAAANSGGVNAAMCNRALPANSDLDRRRRAQCAAITAAVINRGDHHFRETALGAAQLLAPPIDLSGTNLSATDDISDNRPWCEGRSHNGALFAPHSTTVAVRGR